MLHRETLQGTPPVPSLFLLPTVSPPAFPVPLEPLPYQIHAHKPWAQDLLLKTVPKKFSKEAVKREVGVVRYAPPVSTRAALPKAILPYGIACGILP